MLLHPGAAYDGTRFSGTPLQALMALLVLGGVTAFALTTMLYGLSQMRTGLRNLRAIYAMLGLVGVVVLVAMAL